MACHALVKCCKCSKVFPAFRCYTESRIICCFNCKPVQWWVHCSLWFLSLLFFLWSPVPLMFVIVLFLVGPLPSWLLLSKFSGPHIVFAFWGSPGFHLVTDFCPCAYSWQLKPLEQTHSVLLSWVSSPSLLLGRKYFSAFTSLRGWLPSNHAVLFP